jgi:hypothetical protein
MCFLDVRNLTIPRYPLELLKILSARLSYLAVEMGSLTLSLIHRILQGLVLEAGYGADPQHDSRGASELALTVLLSSSQSWAPKPSACPMSDSSIINV